MRVVLQYGVLVSLATISDAFIDCRIQSLMKHRSYSATSRRTCATKLVMRSTDDDKGNDSGLVEVGSKAYLEGFVASPIIDEKIDERDALGRQAAFISLNDTAS